MIFHPAQSIIAKDAHRFRVVNCGRRFGKTSLSVQEMFAFAIAKDDAKIAYVAPNYQQARDIAWTALRKTCEAVIVNTNEQRLEVIVKNVRNSTSQITLRGWESIDTLRGQFFDFLVLDEVSSYRNFWLSWQEVLRPTLTDRKGQCLFISTPKGYNHFYDLYNFKEKDKDYKSFHFTSYDNPYIPKEEIDKARLEITEDRFAQEYLADFRKTEGLVYKEFNRHKHVYDEDDEIFEDLGRWVKVMVGVDFGFTNPAAVLTAKKDDDAKYCITDEWYKRGKTDAQIADYVASIKHNECYPDPENAGGIKELEDRGVNVREVNKGKGSVVNGINVVRELFKSNRLFIHKSCINTIHELETYSYPEKKPDRNEDELPIKEGDHAMDAMRYCLMQQGAGYDVEQSTTQYRPSFVQPKPKFALKTKPSYNIYKI